LIGRASINALDDRISLLDRVNEGHAYLLERNGLELRQHRMTKGFGRNARAVRNNKNSAFGGWR
jgi:hypothetical protein